MEVACNQDTLDRRATAAISGECQRLPDYASTSARSTVKEELQGPSTGPMEQPGTPAGWPFCNARGTSDDEQAAVPLLRPCSLCARLLWASPQTLLQC